MYETYCEMCGEINDANVEVEGENEPNNGETCESKRKIEIP